MSDETGHSAICVECGWSARTSETSEDAEHVVRSLLREHVAGCPAKRDSIDLKDPAPTETDG